MAGPMKDIVINCHIKGVRPLLMNAFGSEEDKSVAKKGKVYDDKEEAEKRLYRDKDGNVCQPATHLEACMVKSAADFKFAGKKTYKDIFKSGIFVDPLMIPHLKTDWDIDKQSVVVQRSRILRCRPRFDEWELKFRILVRDDRIEPLVVKQILENGGKYVGIGDFRPRYGLFEVVGFEVAPGGN